MAESDVAYGQVGRQSARTAIADCRAGMKQLFGFSSSARKHVLTPSLAAAAFALGLCSCNSVPMPREAFSESWREKRANDREIFREDESRTIPILGKGENAAAAIVVDEEGKAKLRVGKLKGVRVDVDVHHGKPEASVGYRLKFGGKKKYNPASQKPSPFD